MYEPNSKRYLTMTYNRCGKSGLKLPAVSLGLWHNFGDTADYENMKALVFTAFDNGITHCKQLRSRARQRRKKFRQNPQRGIIVLPR